MGTSDLPDMYAQGLRTEGIHISQITKAHVTTIMYHFVAIVTIQVVWILQIIVTLVCDAISTYKLLMHYGQGAECLHSPTIFR